MEAIEQDRAIIKTLSLEPAEIAMLCARFQNEDICGPFFMSLGNEAVHNDLKGKQWRVDTKELARKLNATGIKERGALTRAIFRFWEQYPNADPADAMRNAGLV
jgi:hypothetical protein